MCKRTLRDEYDRCIVDALLQRGGKMYGCYRYGLLHSIVPVYIAKADIHIVARKALQALVFVGGRFEGGFPVVDATCNVLLPVAAGNAAQPEKNNDARECL